jgi:cytochrome b6-f complex iron-sulfur subunit
MSSTRPVEGNEPQPGLEDRSRPEDVDRRKALSKLGVGVVGAAVALPVVMSARALIPNALYEKPRRFKVRQPDQLANGPTFIADHKVFVFREAKVFYCISAVCTHLGCTVQMVRTGSGQNQQDFEFHCPCHGSKFRADGTRYAGPAPRSLNYYRLELAPDDGQLVVDLSETAEKGWRFTV